MPMIPDFIQKFLESQFRWPQGNDKLMERPVMEGEKAGKVVDPKNYQADQATKADKRNIYDEHGNIVDYDMGSISNDPIGQFLKKQMMGIGGKLGKRSEGGSVSDLFSTVTSKDNPFGRLLEANKGANGQGTIMGLLSRFLSPTPERYAEKQVQGYGTVGGGDTSGGIVPGTGTDPGLDPTPTKNQKVRAFKRIDQPSIDPNNGDLDRVPPAPTVDYSMPNALDPNQIEELRRSLLTGAGQLDINNPNGLAGRMNDPNSKIDQQGQMSEAQRQADELNSLKGSNNADRRNQY